MFAAVEIPLLDGPSVLAVPAAAIQSVDGKPTVFVRQSPTIFEVRTVSSGSEEGGWVEILDGLSEGEEVVSEGSFELKSVLLRDSLAEED
jgi:cobalt-zinc-cadmium efflux system membrane fusion protein